MKTTNFIVVHVKATTVNLCKILKEVLVCDIPQAAPEVQFVLGEKLNK